MRRGLVLAGVLAVVVAAGLAVSTEGGEPGRARLSAEERRWLDEHVGALTLLFNREFPPIEFASPEGAFVGLGADVIALVEQRLGVTFRKRPCNDWNVHLAALASGECAIAPTIVRTADREQFAFFSEPYASAPVVIITTSSFAGGASLDELGGRRVAVVSGFATERYVRERAAGRFQVLAVRNVPEGLLDVSFVQADALVENLAVAAWYIEQKGVPNLRVAGTTDYSFAWSIGVSRRYPLLYSAIDKALRDIPEREIEAVRRRWITLELPTRMDPELVRLLQVVALSVGALVLCLTGISWLLKRRLNEKVARLRAAQEELQQSEELHRGLVSAIPDVVLRTALDGTIVYVNDSDSPLLREWGRGSVIGRNMMEFLVPEDRPLAAARTRLMFEAYQGVQEYRVQGPTGRTISCDVNGDVLRDAAGAPHGMVYVVRDVSARVRAEQAIRDSEARFRELFEMAPLPLVECWRDGTVLGVNLRFTQVFGYTLADIPSLDTWWPLAYPDCAYREEVLRRWDAAVSEAEEPGAEIAPSESLVTCKDGTVCTVQIAGRAMSDKLLVSFFDVTDRVRAEEEREVLHTRLLHAQKMEAVGRLAGGVAHDFNNMLGVILGHVEMARLVAAAGDPLAEDLEAIEGAARRSAELTRQLLAFARKQTVSPRVLEVNETVTGMLKMLRRLIGEMVELVWRPEEVELRVVMDPAQVDQILVNLCVNARDAMGGAGRVTIETDRATFDTAMCEERPGFLPGEFVRLAVSDDGRGMDEATKAKIFEPFFTTKELGQGTGLGLATVYGIVHQNGGFIDVWSAPGEGTTVALYLPRHLAGAESSREPEGKEAPRGHGETVLVVEDEPAILRVVQTMLGRLGYQVLAAGAPEQALDLARSHAGEIHLVLTDVVMPSMNGRELAELLRARYPGLRCLFMSGYTADVIARQGVLGNDVKVLQKPFLISDLAEKVRAALAVG